ncbi:MULTISPECIES: dermonecrotic toxin domain-containing protein [unclassified Pseudomonas]|uniref:dermonecrotic toxin domain-containing protein n=1 Tax=unclassified Pseudomonas TaxID=196821 RepID=UPI0035C1FE8C
MSLAIENPHHTLLENRLPRWAASLGRPQWQALRSSLPEAATDQGSPRQAQLEQARRALARALDGLRQPAEFAEPLLVERLGGLFTSPLLLRAAELVRIHPLFSHGVYVYSHERHTLLEAALQNFAESLTFSSQSSIALSQHIEVTPSTVVGQTTLGDSETLVDITLDSQTYAIEPLPLSPQAFAQAVRELDLGQRYQDHLDEIFARPQVVACTRALHKAGLGQALERVEQQGWLDEQTLMQMQRLLEHDSPLHSQQLALFGLTLHEVLVFDQQERGLLLYLPSETPQLRLFADLAALNAQLCIELLEPPFRRQVLGYLQHCHQATFLDRLQQNLDGSGSAALDAQWPLRVGADLHLSLTDIPGELFTFLFNDHLARLKADARQVAVPTAEADERARQRRRDTWQSLGLNALMVAGFFIPAVGTLMTAVMAYQLLDEAFEGYEAWSAGDRHLALRHLEGVGLNLALAGGLHLAGSVPKLFNSELMESLDPVTLADGSQRLWRADLTRYRSTLALSPAREANALGQYLHEGRHYIRLDGHLYVQGFDEAQDCWRILHPDRSQAYRPRLEHNGNGAWRVEHERPRQWSLAKRVRRLDSRWDGLDDTQLEQAAHISGMSQQDLARLHLANAPTPPLLADTLLRMQAESRTQADLALEPLRDHDALFQQFYEGDPADGVEHGRLLEAFPTLTRPLVQRLLADLDSEELDAWRAADRLPARLEAAAKRTSAALPLARALEGLYLPGLSSVQSERLILRALPDVPGWSPDWRVELRAASPQGATLAAAGKPTATEVQVVIKSPLGYEAHLGERPAPAVQDNDLCRAIFDALPAAQRRALGIEEAGPAALRERIHQQVQAAPQRFERHLREQGAHGWGRGAGLRGGAPNERPIRPEPMDRETLYRRYLAIFPSATDEEIRQRVASWTQALRDPATELERLARPLQHLRQRLSRWAGNSTRRRRAADRLVSCWQRNTRQRLDEDVVDHVLDLSGLGLSDADLASLTLPDEFHHVVMLDLSASPTLSALPPDLLARFPRLQRLYLRGCRFDHVPQVAVPAALERLDLEDNRITWDLQAQAALDRLLGLESLDLSGNPLIASPDLSALDHLLSLRLNGCALSTWPQGVERMESPLVLDLANNQFSALPEPLMLSRDAALNLRLESSALGQQALEQIEAYYQAEGVDLLVDDADYDELLSGSTLDEWLIWNRLPLQYRRDLRAILESDAFDRDPEGARTELWRRLILIDGDAQLLAQALANPAAQLLSLPF